MTPQQAEQALRDEMPGWTDSAYAQLAELHVEVERQRAAGVPFIRVEAQK